MAASPPFSLGFADEIAVDFCTPFMNPLEATKQMKVEEPLTPVSNPLSRSSTDSHMSVVDKRIKNKEYESDEQITQKKRKTSDANEGKGDKRQVLLQKNRVAAQKCREKKKKETEGMMQRCEHLEKENERLKCETKLLTEETNNLKMMIMGHVGSTPGCGYFNGWIESQAQAVINKKKIQSADSLDRKSSFEKRRNESIASTISITSTELSPESLFNFDDEMDVQATSWSMQPQPMNTAFTTPITSYSTMSLNALQACDPIDPSLTTTFSPVVKDESDYSDQGVPGGGSSDILGMSPQLSTMGSRTRVPNVAADSAMTTQS